MVDIQDAKYLEYHVYWLKLAKIPKLYLMLTFLYLLFNGKNINCIRYLLLALFIQCVI